MVSSCTHERNHSGGSLNIPNRIEVSDRLEVSDTLEVLDRIEISERIYMKFLYNKVKSSLLTMVQALDVSCKSKPQEWWKYD